MKFVAFCGAILLFIASCQSQPVEITNSDISKTLEVSAPILPGIFKMDTLVALIGSQRVGIVANNTSRINGTHLLDTLLNRGIDVVKVFAPEHGFRGDAPDGADIANDIDPTTGTPLVSLYGKNKKATPEMLKDIDILVFDIQDVGARFFTYLSTLHYAMEAAAENGMPVIVLDRPNPNGFYIDGPVLKPKFQSFIGLVPVPVVYGMTIGEYGQMLNGEGWLKDKVQCDLTVVSCSGYTHKSRYELPVIPSPNLPDMASIYLYPTVCFFEGTDVSVGRGTDSPFTRIGEPGNTKGNFTFTPRSIPTASLHPKHEGEKCTGYNLYQTNLMALSPDSLQIHWWLKMYAETDDKSAFFRKDGYFDLLAGTDSLRLAIVNGLTAKEIRASWQPDLEKFKIIREKYLIYP